MSGTKIHAYLRAGGAGSQHERVGPFLATFTPGSNHPMRNYAIPDDDARPTRTEAGALIDAFARRALTPRLEYFDDAAPDVEAVLLAAGFRVDARLVVLGCRAGEEHPLEVPPRFSVALAASERDHTDAMVVAGDAYGEPGAPDAAAIGARLRMVAAGGAVALARHRPTGAPAGSGQVGVPHAGVSELAAVGVHAQFRSRGIAGAITALLTREAFARGLELLWLTAESAQAERIYARVGYRPIVGHMVHMSVPKVGQPG